MKKLTFIVPVHNQERFDSNIGKSKIYLDGNHKFRIITGQSNVRKALNIGLSCYNSEYIVMCHEDVYFPDEFESHLHDTLDKLEHTEFGVLGFAGVNRIPNGKEYMCSVIDRGRIYGKRVDQLNDSIEVETLDELCLITKNAPWVFFDETIPSRHLYGAELCFRAVDNYKKNYVIPPRVHHNANEYGYLAKLTSNMEMIQAADFLKKDYSKHFPFSTTCMDFK